MAIRSKLYFCALALGFLAGCASQTKNDVDDVDLVFADFRFKVPPSPVAVGVQEPQLFLALRYSSEAGQHYLTFSNKPRYPASGCSPKAFFALVTETASSGLSHSCDMVQVDDFRDSIVGSASDHGVWAGVEGVEAFYVVQESQKMAFLVGNEDAFLKIDTDFLSLEQLEKLVTSAEQR